MVNQNIPGLRMVIYALVVSHPACGDTGGIILQSCNLAASLVAEFATAVLVKEIDTMPFRRPYVALDQEGLSLF